MTNEKAIMCLEDMKIKVPIPKVAKQARENNEALDVAIKALAESEHSTNLASLGMDCISRQAAIKDAESWVAVDEYEKHLQKKVVEWLKELPPAQPEIVRCKDCKHHWTHRCMDSMPIERCDLEQTFYDAEVDYCSLAERREVTT